MTIYIKGSKSQFNYPAGVAARSQSEYWKKEQRILSHHEGDRLLKMRFKLRHAARNLTMLIEHTCLTNEDPP
jgi:hypothetical protein